MATNKLADDPNDMLEPQERLYKTRAAILADIVFQISTLKEQDRPIGDGLVANSIMYLADVLDVNGPLDRASQNTQTVMMESLRYWLKRLEDNVFLNTTATHSLRASIDNLAKQINDLRLVTGG